MITKNILLLILAMCCLLPLQAAESATSLLERVADKIKGSKSTSASYTISADGHKQNGTIIIAGDRFRLSSPEINSWYDGKTQWTYSTHVGEINMSEPTPDELQQVNPFAIVNSFKNQYTASTLKSNSGEKKIRLTAVNNRNDIRNVVLTINSATLYPSKIELTMSNHKIVEIRLTNIRPGNTLPLSTFRFDASKYPGIPVVDLR